jgi:hypothetical protein
MNTYSFWVMLYSSILLPSAERTIAYAGFEVLTAVVMKSSPGI